jgi:dihydroneopterin aldolase
MLRNLIFDWSGTLTDDEGLQLLPHALEFLRFCRATRRRMFLLSTIEERRFAEQAARLGISHSFERVEARRTDQRQRLADILEKNGLAPSETAFISGVADDLEPAKHPGVLVIATLTGLDSGEKLLRAHPDVMVRDLGELRKLLEVASPNDEIRIEQLELMARVGVPDEERAQPQRLIVSLILQPPDSFHDLKDELRATVDYAAVCAELQRFVADRPTKLIETLAHGMAEHLVRRFELARVELELRKFVLPETRYVAVRVARQR